MQEYKRCAHALKKVGGPRASFLRCYATYLLGEARKEEERLEAGGLLGNGQAVNKVPVTLHQNARSVALAFHWASLVLKLAGPGSAEACNGHASTWL